MAFNKQLLVAINDANFKTPPVDPQRTAALEALLAVNPVSVVGLRKAVITFKSVWEVFRTSTTLSWNNDNDFLDETDATNSFLAIQQAAAAQRVKLALDQVTDKQILLEILGNNNEAECRAYLDGKLPNIGFPVWQEPSPAPKKSLGTLLDKNDLPKMRQYAAALWVLKAIENADKLDDLDKLNTLSTNEEFTKVLESLGFPTDKTAALDAIDSRLICGVIEDKLKERKNKLMTNTAQAIYEKYVAGLSDDDVLKQKTLLDEDSNLVFLANLNKLAPYASYASLEGKNDIAESIRARLGARFLKAALEKGQDVKKDAFLEALKTDDLNAFKDELKKLYPEHTYIDTLITAPEQMKSYQGMMAHHVFSDSIRTVKVSDVAALDGLDKAPNLKKFQELLENIGADKLKAAIPHLTISGMIALQNTARERLFDNLIEGAEQHLHLRLGKEAHPQLRNIFNKLSIEDQRALLQKPTADNIPALFRIVNAKDINELQKYLKGIPESDLQDLLQENAKNDSLKGIHNSEVAKILADLSIGVSKSQVGEINKVFKSSVSSVNKSTYLALINSIEKECSLAPAKKVAFYRAFGLSDDGAKIAPKGDVIQDKVATQYMHNQSLLKAYNNDDNKPIKQFLSLMLRVTKSEPYNATSISLSAIPDLKNSKTPKEFLDKFLPEATVKKDRKKRELKIALERELTPQLLLDIQSDIQKAELEKAEERPKVIKRVQGYLKEVQKESPLFDKDIENMGFIRDIQNPEIYVHSPLFKNNYREMKVRYSGFERKCDRALEHLNHRRILLERDLGSLADRTESQAVELKKNLQKEIAQIEGRLDFYAEIKGKIAGDNGILNAIDKVDSKFPFIESAEVKISNVARADLAKRAIDKSSAVVSSVVSASSTTHFSLADKLGPDQVKCFDVTATGPSKIEGLFIYDAYPPGQSNVTRTSEPGKFEIHKFPSTTTRTPAAQQEAIEAKINFSIIMATQILMTLDAPPTKEKPLVLRGIKEEELKYLWTALVILGEKPSNMCFDRDAIQVHSTAFNPKSQIGFMGRYTDNSVHKEFEKFKSTDQFFKAQLQNIKKDGEQRQKKEKIASSTDELMATKLGPIK